MNINPELVVSIPLDVERSCERRWAARFSRPVVPVVSRKQGPEGKASRPPRPARAKEKPAGLKRRAGRMYQRRERGTEAPRPPKENPSPDALGLGF